MKMCSITYDCRFFLHFNVLLFLCDVSPLDLFLVIFRIRYSYRIRSLSAEAQPPSSRIESDEYRTIYYNILFLFPRVVYAGERAIKTPSERETARARDSLF